MCFSLFSANSTLTNDEHLDDVTHDAEMLSHDVKKMLSEKDFEVEKILSEKDVELEKLKKKLSEAEKQLRIQTQVCLDYYRGAFISVCVILDLLC